VPVAGSVTTASDGTFVLCGAPNGPFTPVVTANGYVTMYYEEFQGGANSSLNFIEGFETTDFAALSSFLPGGYNPNEGVILVTLTPASCPTAGWSLALTDTDGGLVPSGSYQLGYLGAQGFPQSGLTATTTTGSAFLYNIDLSSGNFFGVQATNPDAGTCAPELSAYGANFTGRLYVTVNSVTVDVMLFP
jgi:hypothetical protein